MTEHEKFFGICDEIGYKLPTTNFYGSGEVFDFNNVREIIFTPDFWNKFIKYCAKINLNKKIKYNDLLEDLFENNLHDPVTYLYNLLFNE